MSPSIFREWRVQLPLAASHPIPLRLTMANDQEATDCEPHQTILATGQPHPRDRLPQRGREPSEGSSDRSIRDVYPSDNHWPDFSNGHPGTGELLCAGRGNG